MSNTSEENSFVTKVVEEKKEYKTFKDKYNG